MSGIAVVLAGRDDDELARHSLVLMSRQMAVLHVWQWNTQGHFWSVWSANDNSSRTEVSGAMQTVSFRPASSGRGGSPFRSRRRNYTPGGDGGGRLRSGSRRAGRAPDRKGKVLRCEEFQHVEVSSPPASRLAGIPAPNCGAKLRSTVRSPGRTVTTISARSPGESWILRS